MKERITSLFHRITTILAPLSARLFAEGRLAAFIRGTLFVGAASTVGLYLALDLFIPDEAFLGMVNRAAASRDLAVEVENVGFSPFGSVMLDDLTVKNQEGKKVLTIGSLTLSPHLWPLLRGEFGATATLTDIGGAGGTLKIRYDPGEEFCVGIEGTEAPLSALRLFWPDLEIGGAFDGEALFCR